MQKLRRKQSDFPSQSSNRWKKFHGGLQAHLGVIKKKLVKKKLKLEEQNQFIKAYVLLNTMEIELEKNKLVKKKNELLKIKIKELEAKIAEMENKWKIQDNEISQSLIDENKQVNG